MTAVEPSNIKRSRPSGRRAPVAKPVGLDLDDPADPPGSLASTCPNRPDGSESSASTVITTRPGSNWSCTVGLTESRTGVGPVESEARHSRTNRLVPQSVSGSSGRFPHAFTNDSSLIGSLPTSDIEATRPVSGPANSEQSAVTLDPDRLNPRQAAEERPPSPPHGRRGSPTPAPEISNGIQESISIVPPVSSGGSTCSVHSSFPVFSHHT